MAPLCCSYRGRTPEDVGSGLRRAGRRQCKEDQKTADENAFGGEWERIRRWLPLVVSETRYRDQGVRRVVTKSREDLNRRQASQLPRMEKTNRRMNLESRA